MGNNIAFMLTYPISTVDSPRDGQRYARIAFCLLRLIIASPSHPHTRLTNVWKVPKKNCLAFTQVKQSLSNSQTNFKGKNDNKRFPLTTRSAIELGTWNLGLNSIQLIVWLAKTLDAYMAVENAKIRPHALSSLARKYLSCLGAESKPKYLTLVSK